MLDVIVINRIEDVDRLAFMTSQLDSLGIRFYRLDAFTVDTLAEGSTSLVANRHGLSEEEQACLLSHMAAWEWVVKHGPALILEDDTILARQIADLLKDVSTTDMMEHLSLEVRGAKKLLATKSIPIGHGVAAHRLYHDRSGAAAYILWPSGARKLLARARRPVAVVDRMIRHSHDIRSFQASPALAIQLDMSCHYGLELGLPAEVLGRAIASKPSPMRSLARALEGTGHRIWQRIRHAGTAKRTKVPVKIEFFDY